MRGNKNFQGGLFSYMSLEERVPKSHPLRKLRAMMIALATMDSEFEAVYARRGRRNCQYNTRACLVSIDCGSRAARALHTVIMSARHMETGMRADIRAPFNSFQFRSTALFDLDPRKAERDWPTRC